MPQPGTSARTSPRAAFAHASARAAEKWFVEKDGIAEPSAELLASLRRLDDENLRKAYSEGSALVRSELARLKATSEQYSAGAVFSESGQLVAHPTPMLPVEFYQAMAITIGSLDRLALLRMKSLKAKDDMFAEASDEELNANLLRAMAQLMEEAPIADLEDVIRRRRKVDADAKWNRDVKETPVLELAPADVVETTEEP
jgi:hypothetical protein